MLRETAQSWTAVRPGLVAGLRSIDALPGPASEHGGVRCSPHVDEETAWADLWETWTYGETVFGFQIMMGYARTYHNRTADLLPRSTADELEKEAHRRGMVPLDVVAGWRRAVESAARARVPIFPGLNPAETVSALKPKAPQLARLGGTTGTIRRDLHLLEVGRGLGDLAVVWRALGGGGRHPPEFENTGR